MTRVVDVDGELDFESLQRMSVCDQRLVRRVSKVFSCFEVSRRLAVKSCRLFVVRLRGQMMRAVL